MTRDEFETLVAIARDVVAELGNAASPDGLAKRFEALFPGLKVRTRPAARAQMKESQR